LSFDFAIRNLWAMPISFLSFICLNLIFCLAFGEILYSPPNILSKRKTQLQNNIKEKQHIKTKQIEIHPPFFSPVNDFFISFCFFLNCVFGMFGTVYTLVVVRVIDK